MRGSGTCRNPYPRRSRRGRQSAVGEGRGVGLVRRLRRARRSWTRSPRRPQERMEKVAGRLTGVLLPMGDSGWMGETRQRARTTGRSSLLKGYGHSCDKGEAPDGPPRSLCRGQREGVVWFLFAFEHVARCDVELCEVGEGTLCINDGVRGL